MIVFDEQLQGLGLEDAIARWYRGGVLVVKKLRPGMVIKDDAIPKEDIRISEVQHQS
jgi:hypothetical protein